MKKLIPFVGAALISFLVLSAVNVVIFRVLRERSRLVSRNDCERTLSAVFTSLRGHDDFGSVIEATPGLKEKILGLGFYNEAGAVLYRWGTVPEPYTPPSFKGVEVSFDMASKYLENPANGSLVVLLRPTRDRPPLPPPPAQGTPGAQERQPSEGSPQTPGVKGHETREGLRRSFSAMFEILRRTNTIYMEILQPRYWGQVRTQAVLFPTVEIVFAALVSYVAFVVMKNVEYRRRIEEQKNLVVLGTAASTLAHEIKNPLLAIRLQTSIIAKSLPGKAQRELDIIDSEVERLSALSHRVNDFLRDPRGQPERIDAAAVASEVGARLCGRSVFDGRPAQDAFVSMDPERLRSTLENLLRNALESGGYPEEVGIEIGRSDGAVRIDVLDRGAGILPKDRERIFDPFFTTKSRGTGIGLAICRRFIQAAGGAVSLEDRPGGGTTARVVLPEAPP